VIGWGGTDIGQNIVQDQNDHGKKTENDCASDKKIQNKCSSQKIEKQKRSKGYRVKSLIEK